MTVQNGMTVQTGWRTKHFENTLTYEGRVRIMKNGEKVYESGAGIPRLLAADALNDAEWLRMELEVESQEICERCGEASKESPCGDCCWKAGREASAEYALSE